VVTIVYVINLQLAFKDLLLHMLCSIVLALDVGSSCGSGGLAKLWALANSLSGAR
jgi:hypothetical protein